MKQILPLRNPIQPYAWGSHTAIANLLGEPAPSKQPQAEMWMGAHPMAPSHALVDGNWMPLDALIAAFPAQILGPQVAARFANRLPFLFKVLAAARPLSIQAHPTRAQAEEGFRRENELGIPLTARERNYKDDNHKPEIICGLVPWRAMNGFRPLREMLVLLQAFGPPALAAEIAAFADRPDGSGLERFYRAIMTLPRARQATAVAQVVARAEHGEIDSDIARWILRLNDAFPGDIGVLSPILLNVVELQPGQAMFLEAGRLHAYLEGTGIELMANSDNVLRGGLTPKHVDVPELLRIVRFEETVPALIAPEPQTAGEQTYAAPAEEFRLSVIDVDEATPYRGGPRRSVEIMICIRGQAVVSNPAMGQALTVEQGHAFLVPAAVAGYRIAGQARLFKATTGDLQPV